MTVCNISILILLMGISAVGEADEFASSLTDQFEASDPLSQCQTRYDRLREARQDIVRQHELCLRRDGKPNSRSRKEKTSVCSRPDCESLHRQMESQRGELQRSIANCRRNAGNIEKSRAHLEHVTGRSRIDAQRSIESLLENKKTTIVLGALASRLAYGDSEFHATSRYLNKVDEVSDPASGFAGRAFLTPDGSTLFIAFRGTEPSDKFDLRADAGLVLASKLPDGNATRQLSSTLTQQISSADTFTGRVLKKHQAGVRQTIVTGHSLGGFLAQVTSAKNGIEAHTYNAPSATSYISKQGIVQTNSSLQFHHVRPNDRVSRSTGLHHTPNEASMQL